MVRLAALILGMAYIPTALALAGQADRQALALGEPLTLSLNGPAEALEQIDLAPLGRDFEVYSRTLSRQNDAGTLVLTLYPLRPGRLTLPALAAGRERSRPVSVSVHAESDTMPRVEARIETEPAIPHVRQPTRLTLEVCDDGSLDWKRPALPTHSALHLRALGEEQLEVERDGRRCTAHRYHWAALPTQAGEIVLPMPMLEANKFGRRLRLPPPKAAFTAVSVPAWLPLNVPVGRPEISAEPLPREWPLDRPLAWRVSVEGGWSADGLKALLALQLQGQAAFAAYPPGIETLVPEDRNSPRNRLDVTLYALPQETGLLAFPAVTLPYFDPAGGRLESVRLSAPAVQIVNPLHRKLVWGAVGLAGLLVLAALGTALYSALRWRLARRRGLEAIRQADDPAALAAALRRFSLQAAAPAATLGLWQARMAVEMQCDGLQAFVEDLESACYGKGTSRLSELKQRAMTLLHEARPRRRFPHSPLRSP